MSELSGYDEWLPEQTGDDTDEGWGERPGERDEADVADDGDTQRYLEDRPPHHGD